MSQSITTNNYWLDRFCHSNEPNQPERKIRTDGFRWLLKALNFTEDASRIPTRFWNEIRRGDGCPVHHKTDDSKIKSTMLPRSLLKQRKDSDWKRWQKPLQMPLNMPVRCERGCQLWWVDGYWVRSGLSISTDDSKNKSKSTLQHIAKKPPSSKVTSQEEVATKAIPDPPKGLSGMDMAVSSFWTRLALAACMKFPNRLFYIAIDLKVRRSDCAAIKKC